MILLVLTYWLFAWALAWCAVDVWLRKVPLEATGEAGPAAARRLWGSGRRAVFRFAWLLPILYAGVWAELHLPLTLLGSLLLVACLVPAYVVPLVMLRLAISKQFPHLARYLPGSRQS